MRVPLTPLDFYRRSQRLYASKLGVVDGARRFSFGQLGERVERLAGALRVMGLKPRENVSILAPNTHHLLEAFYAVPLAGGVVHPVNSRWPPLEIAALVNDAGGRILIFHADLAPQVREVLGNLKAVEQLIVLEGDPRGLEIPCLEYEALLAHAQPYAPDLSGLDEDAPMALFHTSGGASDPRGVVLSHRTLALHALYAVIAMGLREEDVSLCSVPFSHMNGGGNPQINMAMAATSVLARRNDPETLLSLIERERPSVWITAPTVLERLLRLAGRGRLDRSILRLVLVGGGSLDASTIATAQERLGGRCLEVYGLTETSPFVSGGFGATHAGRPILGVEVALQDEAERAVPSDGESVGEILVRGNGVMSGYHRDPEATQEALRGGWLHTGDLASVGAAGELRIRGRKQDVIRLDGRSVSTDEIEAALASHPAVQECAVVAAPDPDHGQMPVGLVVLRSHARLTEHELIEHTKARLASFKVPGRLEFLPLLPRTEAGAVLKSELRTLYARA